MGPKDKLTYILFTDAKGWKPGYRDDVYALLNEQQKPLVDVPRGSIVVLDNPNNDFDPDRSVSVNVSVVDQPGVKVTALLSQMKVVPKEIVELLRPAKYETRYQLITDARRAPSLECRVGEIVHFTPPGESNPIQAVVRYMGPVPTLGLGIRLGLQIMDEDWDFGDTNGTLDGQFYFSSDERKGVFCHVGQITRIQDHRCSPIFQKSEELTKIGQSVSVGRLVNEFNSYDNNNGGNGRQENKLTLTLSNNRHRNNYAETRDKMQRIQNGDRRDPGSESDPVMRPPSRGRGKTNQGECSGDKRSRSRQDQDFSWNPNQGSGSASRGDKGASVGRGADKAGSMGRGSDRGISKGRGRSENERNVMVGQRRNRAENSLLEIGGVSKSDTLSYVTDSLNSVNICRQDGFYNGGRPAPYIEDLPQNGDSGVIYNKTQYQDSDSDLSLKKTHWSLPLQQWPVPGDEPSQYSVSRQEPQQWNVQREGPPRHSAEPPQWNVTAQKSPAWSETVHSAQPGWKEGQNGETGWKDSQIGVRVPRNSPPNNHIKTDSVTNSRAYFRNNCSRSASLDLVNSGVGEERSDSAPFLPPRDRDQWESPQLWEGTRSEGAHSRAHSHSERAQSRSEGTQWRSDGEKRSDNAGTWGEQLSRSNQGSRENSPIRQARLPSPGGRESPHFKSLHDGGEAGGLGVGSMVQLEGEEGPVYGVVRYLGKLGAEMKVGVEMEEEMIGGHSGWFQNRPIFSCPDRKGVFVPLTHLRPDPRFCGDANASGQEKQNFGCLDCPAVAGFLPPVARVDDVNTVAGRNRGIQGHQNSCYLDATLFSMFCFTSVFDSVLYRPRGPADIEKYEDVQRVLREEIVNPLRRALYVRADRVMGLRTLLDSLSDVQGLTDQEKDPEEFLSCLLQQVMKAEPFLELSSGQTAHHYQLFVEKDPDLRVPTVQDLFDQSFVASGVKLRRAPPALILQMPRFGRQFKVYDRIIPSQLLDITDIIQDSPRQCVICGLLATRECLACYGDQDTGLQSTAFCEGCLQRTHQHHRRKRHKQTLLRKPQGWTDAQAIPRVYMELVAVLCIETSHYVSFVRCGDTPLAPWCFFDSMADRKGEQNGYNIPELSAAPEVEKIFSEEGAAQLKEHPEIPLSEQAKRLVCDAYMCFYQSPNVRMYR